jgi:hypothetical protein
MSDEHQPLAPTTTLQEDITTASQRRVNLIWEYTQAIIAVFVVFSCTLAAIWAAFNGKEPSAFLAFICGNVVGFYFSRTNHAAIGGIGHKPLQKYEGR